MSQDERHEVHVDASTFQRPLLDLAEVLAQKIRREAPKILSAPAFVSVDLHVLTRHAMYTYAVLFYLNADERRETDCYWRNAYGIVTLPLIRNMIDCLYNTTLILQNPRVNGSRFRKSGFRKTLGALQEDETRYGGQEEWDEWIRKTRQGLDFQMRENGLSISDVLAETPWPTMGAYIHNKQPGGITTAHQDFLKTFTYGHWREYSAMAHGAFEGLLPTGMFYITDSFTHDERSQVDETYPRVLAMHLARAAVILLCMITELQAYFHFDGADIDGRIHKVWNALMPIFEVKELYDQRYAQLMRDKGINAA